MKVSEIVKYTEWIPSQDYHSSKPEVSFLMPTFRRNKSGLFTRAVNSVLNQELDNIELIIVDDGSTDGTFEQIVRIMKHDKRVSCLHHPRNVGLPAISEYEAFKKARADYFAFAFDDFEFRPGSIKHLLEFSRKENTFFAHGYAHLFYDNPKSNKNGYLVLGRDHTIQSSLNSTNSIANSSTLVHRRVLENIGLYDPHICMVRLCDWDLWRRIAQDYVISFLDLFVGNEYGPSTNDSIGKTTLMDSWLVNEWSKAKRNHLLRPEAFEDYDVLEIPGHISTRGKAVINDLCYLFKDKYWFELKPKPYITKKRKDKGTYITDKPAEGNILVIAGNYNASVSLYFDYLPEDISQRVRVIQYNHFSLEEMVHASAVIFVRQLLEPATKVWIETAQLLRIPCYYYIDDNLIALSEEDGEESTAIHDYSLSNVRNSLSSFNGVLLSTKKLIEYFERNSIHDHLMYYPPIAKYLNKRTLMEKTHGDRTLRIAFMGGWHRIDNFNKYVLPAIQRLSEHRRIELLVPYSQQDVYRIKANENTVVKRIERTISYNAMLMKYQANKIDILVHPNSNSINNEFKTMNVLINSMLLGAIPILSKDEPYKNLEGLGVAILCENDENEWFSAISDISSNRGRRTEYLDNLADYCRTNFSGSENSSVLRMILGKHKSPSQLEVEHRYRILLQLQRTKAQIGPATQITPQLVHSNIIASRKIEKYKKCRIFVDHSNLSSITIFLGTHQKECSGTIKMILRSLDRSNTILRESEIELESIYDNGPAVFYFKPIENTENSFFNIDFVTNYKSGSNKISIYEHKSEESKYLRYLKARLMRSRQLYYLINT
jgi:glycosyltransferase involved in cell wall biosynthesis